jgi:ABC-type lipoprotein export system ATPase subunit
MGRILCWWKSDKSIRRYSSCRRFRVSTNTQVTLRRLLYSRGEFLILRGPSGGGKTTLLNILGTIDTPTGGELEIMGQVINEKSEDAYLASLRLARIGFVFQTYNLLATMSAFENVELPMTILGQLSESERKKRAEHLLSCKDLPFVLS